MFKRTRYDAASSSNVPIDKANLTVEKRTLRPLVKASSIAQGESSALLITCISRPTAVDVVLSDAARAQRLSDLAADRSTERHHPRS